MTREQRAQLLRKNLSGRPVAQPTKPLGQHRTDHPRELDRRELKQERYEQKPETGYLQWIQYSCDHSGRAPQWFVAPPAQPEDQLKAEVPSGMKIASAIEKGWEEDGLLPPEERADELGCLKPRAKGTSQR